MKKVGLLCLLIPFLFSTLNIQAFLAIYFSPSVAQLFAYSNLILVIIGTLFYLRPGNPYPGLIRLWLLFFGCYYIIGGIASAIHNTPSPFQASLIPFIYFCGFTMCLNDFNNQAIYIKTATGAFFVATLAVIVFQAFNYSIDVSGVSDYRLERAGGVYGDANQSALVSLITLLLVYNFFRPSNRTQRVFKFITILVAGYALFLTFSKTGFIVLLFVLTIIFYRRISLKKILIVFGAMIILVAVGLNRVIESDRLTFVQKRRIDDIINLVTFNTDKVALSERDVLLKNMLNFVMENPIGGNGISFSNMIRGHNTIIGVWADAGILTFIVFITIIFMYYRKSFSLESSSARAFAFATVVVLTVFMLSLQSIINQPYLITLFVFMAYYVTRKSNYEPDSQPTH